MTDPFIIIGASHAGIALAGALRRKGWEAGITLIERQEGTPVQRPPLSKSALKADWPEDKNYIQSPLWFEKQDIRFLSGATVTEINPEARTVSTEAGDRLSWSKLALATGATPRMLTCPGSTLDGVHYVRTLADAYALRDDLQDAKNVAVVGGGYIGLEAAACIHDMGKKVTVVEMMDRLLARVATPDMSAFFERLHRDQGVTILTGDGVDRLEGGDRVERVVTSSGQVLDADAIVVGIGVIPDLQLLQSLSDKDENGVAVNRHCQTSDPDIYAIGDIAKFDWPFASMRIESIHNAQYTATLAAHHVLGIDPPKYETPWFWSDQHGGKLQSVGVPMNWDSVVWRDGGAAGSGAAFAFNGETLVSVEAFNLPPAFLLGKKIFAGTNATTKSEIEDTNNDLRALMKRS